MGSKPWYQSKIIWGAVFTILITAWNVGVNSVFGLPEIPEFIYAILGFLGLYARKTTTTTIR